MCQKREHLTATDQLLHRGRVHHALEQLPQDILALETRTVGASQRFDDYEPEQVRLRTGHHSLAASFGVVTFDRLGDHHFTSVDFVVGTLFHQVVHRVGPVAAAVRQVREAETLHHALQVQIYTFKIFCKCYTINIFSV